MGKSASLVMMRASLQAVCYEGAVPARDHDVMYYSSSLLINYSLVLIVRV
jgi:hypothetical protein